MPHVDANDRHGANLDDMSRLRGSPHGLLRWYRLRRSYAACLAALLLPLGASAQTPPQAPNSTSGRTESQGWTPVMSKGPSVGIGDYTLTFGGFFALEGLYREHNLTSDVATPYKSLPFKDTTNYNLSEFRTSFRASRLDARLQGPADGANQFGGFVSLDFLGSSTTTNSYATNSYLPRPREVYATWADNDFGTYLLFGQTWSLATMARHGLEASSVLLPPGVDQQSVPGAVWLRAPELRLVKNFGRAGALGIALDTPQNAVKGTIPPGATATTPGGALFDSSVQYSTDVAPDVIVKGELEPGWGHYELYSLTRFFRDRAPATAGVPASITNNITVGESIGLGALLPLIPHTLEFHVSTLVGRGNGRYGGAELGDTAFNPNNGRLVALKEQQGVAGLIAHPTPEFDLWAALGVEHIESAYSFGNGNGDNSGCNISLVDIPTVAGVPVHGCTGAISAVRQATGGFWWTFIHSHAGSMKFGLQAQYTQIETFADAKGNIGRTHNPVLYLSLRYYPFH